MEETSDVTEIGAFNAGKLSAYFPTQSKIFYAVLSILRSRLLELIAEAVKKGMSRKRSGQYIDHLPQILKGKMKEACLNRASKVLHASHK